MELNYIKEFVKLSEIGGFQKAAEEMNISQSSLSQHIKRLEEQLGFRLLDRSSRSARLTIAGRHFLEYARQFARLENECSAEMAQYRGQEKYSLRLGTRILNRYHLTELLSKYRFLYPNIEIQIQEASAADLKKMLLQNDCDVIIIRQLEQAGEQFCSILLTTDDSVLAVPANHPLAQSSPVSLKDFQNDTFIAPGDQHILNKLCKKVCRNAGFEPHISDSAKNTHTILSMVECGMGISVISKEMRDPSFENIVYLEYEHSIPIYVYLHYQKDRKPSMPCRLFVECCEKYS